MSLFRRFSSIKTVPAGIAKSAKKIVQGKVPDLSKYEDISEFFLKYDFCTYILQYTIIQLIFVLVLEP